jgi:hypothetical protein
LSVAQSDFLDLALAARPSMFANATYFAGHPYPANCNSPFNSSINLPVELGGNSTWMKDAKELRELSACHTSQELV